MGRREAYLLDINILPLIYLIRAVKDGLFRKVLHFGFRFEYECYLLYSVVAIIYIFRGGTKPQSAATRHGLK